MLSPVDSGHRCVLFVLTLAPIKGAAGILEGEGRWMNAFSAQKDWRPTLPFMLRVDLKDLRYVD